MLEVDKNENELENYGVWVKSGPDNYTDEKGISASEDFELTDLDNGTDNFLLTEEEERLLDSLEEDVKSGEDTDDLFNIQEIDDLDFEEEYKESDVDNLEEEEFIDIEIPQSIESKEASKSSVKKEDFAEEEDSKSFAMLSRIATDLKNDLSSIKNELHELKLELSKYKKMEAKETQEAEAPEEDETASGGFFSDDGDETIALTGDELDNIFNTAEITEESQVFEEGEEPDAETYSAEPVPEPESDSFEENIEIDIPSEELFEENKEELDFLEGKPEEIISEASDTSEEITEEDIINTENELKEKNDYNLPDEDKAEDDLSALPEQEITFDNENNQEKDNPDNFEMSLDDELTLDIPDSGNEKISLDDELNLDAVDEEIALDEDFTEQEIKSDNGLSVEDTAEEVEEEINLDNDFTVEDAVEEVEEEITLDDDFSLDDNKEITLDEGPVTKETPEAEDFSLEDISLDEEISLEDEISIHEDLSEEEEEDKKTTKDNEPENYIQEINEETRLDTTFEKPDVKIGTQKPEDEPPAEEDFSIDLDDTNNIAEILTDEESQLEDDFAMDIPDSSESGEAQEEESIAGMEETEDFADKKNLEDIPENLKIEIKSVLVYLDQLLEALPEGKIEEFAKSEHFKTYKKLFQELGLM